jgi:UDPglucose 6-dehydrogenase
MKIAVIGSGYVGLTQSVCLANLGNDCIGVDIDEKKVKTLNSGIIPIYEPGLKDLLEINLKEKRLYFTTDLKKAVRESEVIFICVGTPENDDGSVDMRYVWQAAEEIGKAMNGYKVIVDKSTVPVGTADKVKAIIKKAYNGNFDIVSNPEFLREGAAIKDFFNPSRVIVGTNSKKARKAMVSIYRAVERTESPIFVTDIKSAELIKYASNAFLATKISFINELSRFAEKVGADIKHVAKGMGLDERIGSRFLQAGIGYGGSCFPKDVKGIINTAKENNMQLKILEAADLVNDEQRAFVLEKAMKALQDNVKGKTVAIWGLAFKPKTDDMRDAPSITIIQGLQKRGAKINAFDPVAQENAKKVMPNIGYFSNPYDAAKDADLLIVVTEWDQFRELDKKRLKALMRQPNIVDARNVYDPKEARAAGFNYYPIGRK